MVSGSMPTSASAVATLPPLIRRTAPCPGRSTLPRRSAGSTSRGDSDVWILEHDLHLLAERPHVLGIEAVDPLPRLGSVFRRDEPQHRKPSVVLPDPDSHDAQRLPAFTSTSTPSTALICPTVFLKKPRLIGNQTLRFWLRAPPVLVRRPRAPCPWARRKSSICV